MVLANDTTACHFGMGVENGFDFLREDFHACDVDYGFFPSDECEVAVGVAHDEIAAGEPSVIEWFWIPWDEVGVQQSGASDEEFSGGAVWDGVSSFIDNGDLVGGKRLSK